jgi:hypothetical protein
MKKIKLQIGKGISKKWISSFLSNVLGVIVGIALTFGISYLIQRHNEKKDTKELMTLIKKELNENKQWLKNRKQDYVADINAYRNILLVKTGNVRNIPADSLIMWLNQTGMQPQSFISTNAWDILKGTETIAKFHNKDLIIELAECYFWINQAREIMVMYYKEKENTIITFMTANTILDYTVFPYDYIDALLANKEIETFFTGLIRFSYYSIEENFHLFENVIDYTLYLIEKDENADKDILDFDSFREQKEMNPLI